MDCSLNSHPSRARRVRRGARSAALKMLARAAAMSAVMTAHERFLFDLNGFLVVRNVFTPEEISAANAAIDANVPSMRARDAHALRNSKAGTRFSAAGARKDMVAR